jgi:translation initiation factor 2B subunit (eIF-2B alpha/beta/delta family)
LTATASSAVLCSSGATAIAVAAKAQNVPVIVFASSLSILPVGQEVVHAIANSQSADPKTALGLSLVEANYLGLGSSNRDENSFLPSVVCPLWDALGNDLVDLLVSSSGISTL